MREYFATLMPVRERRGYSVFKDDLPGIDIVLPPPGADPWEFFFRLWDKRPRQCEMTVHIAEEGVFGCRKVLPGTYTIVGDLRDCL